VGIAAVLVLGWLILPFYFITSGVYLNWPVVDEPGLIARLFVGVGSGRHLGRAVLHLHRVRGPAPPPRRCHSERAPGDRVRLVPVGTGLPRVGAVLTIPFALLQAVIFLKTRSLAYVVTVHLLFDAVVFAVLVHAHNPGMLDGLFLVSP
jgi:hypothetical protein